MHINDNIREFNSITYLKFIEKENAQTWLENRPHTKLTENENARPDIAFKLPNNVTLELTNYDAKLQWNKLWL